jgi:hypothetical protein
VHCPEHGTFRIAGEESLDGVPVLRIEGSIVTDTFELSLRDLAERAQALEDAGLGGDDDMERLVAMGMEMSLRLDRTETTVTSWFDPAAGVVARARFDVPFHISMSRSRRGSHGVDLAISGNISQTIELER